VEPPGTTDFAAEKKEVYQTAAEPRYNVLSNGYQTKWHNYMEAQN
jgi:hypothetical protein